MWVGILANGCLFYEVCEMKVEGNKESEKGELVNAAGRGKSALVEGMRCLYVSRTAARIGGTRSPGAAGAWLVLMLMWKLTPHKFSRN